MWKIQFTKQGKKDSKKIQLSRHFELTRKLLKIIQNNPFQTPPQYEKLKPPVAKMYSRRISRQHRLVYEVEEKLKIVTVLSMWTHYHE